MKRTFFFLCSLLLLAVAAHAQKPELRYENALQFRLINTAFPGETATPWSRIPTAIKDSINDNLWERGSNSSGYGIRFRTDSKTIGAHYRLTYNFHMKHMADTGIKGTDLYILDDNGKWQYVNTARPVDDTLQHKVYVENLDGRMHEFMFYLPLYDGIRWFEIGVDSTATIEAPAIDNPRSHKKIIFYGTSILQGGCASRTGMVATNMIQRDLNLECVNLGVSGEGKLVYAMARQMAQIEDAIAFVIDPVPNCTQMQCDTLTYQFMRILRDARPEVPIIMVEGPMYPYAKFDSFFGNYLPLKNEAFRKNYDKLKAENPANLYYVTCDGLNGPDDEGTVDGIHLTDFGFRAYADKLEKVLLQAFMDQYIQQVDLNQQAAAAAKEAAAAKAAKASKKKGKK